MQATGDARIPEVAEVAGRHANRREAAVLKLEALAPRRVLRSGLAGQRHGNETQNGTDANCAATASTVSRGRRARVEGGTPVAATPHHHHSFTAPETPRRDT